MYLIGLKKGLGTLRVEKYRLSSDSDMPDCVIKSLM